MIKALLIINNLGKARLVKFYEKKIPEEQQKLIREVYQLISKRSETMCNFLAGGNLWGKDSKIIYRQYATLFFVFVVDSSESELGMLDLIQTFVECLDRNFRNVCELDLVFNVERVHTILDEVVMGGMVLETRIQEIVDVVNAMRQAERKESTFATAKSDFMNIFGDISK